jgi:hypothetical protein
MYKNPFTPGYEVLSKSGVVDRGANYLFTNDFPDYAAMFYSPTEHEVISSIKYGNFEMGYNNLREIRESLNGLPMEFYMPASPAVSEGVGRQDEAQVVPVKEKILENANKEALKEIEKAQKQVSGKIRRIEFEDVLLLRKIKRTIVFDKE